MNDSEDSTDQEHRPHRTAPHLGLGVLARFEMIAAATATDTDQRLLPDRLCRAVVDDLLRAQAFTADRLLDDIAADVLTGRLPVPVL